MEPILFGITLNELGALLVLGAILLIFLGILRVLLKLTVAVLRNGCLLTIAVMVLALLYVVLN
jgi:hypothetical protein